MYKLNKNKFNRLCGAALRDFFQHLTKAVCRTSEETSETFLGFGLKMLDGVVFRTNQEMHSSNLLLSETVVQLLGSDRSSVTEIGEIAYRVFADSFRDNVEPTENEYKSQFVSALERYLETNFNFVGPCESFEFAEDVNGLRSDYVSVIQAKEFLSTSSIPTQGKNWRLEDGEKFGEYTADGIVVSTIGGTVWDIKTRCPKDNVHQQARWMAEAFTSLIRLGIKPADYCPRAKYGRAEPSPTSAWITENYGAPYSMETMQFGSKSAPPRYKVDQRFSGDFHSSAFQQKLNAIFGLKEQTLAKRIFDGLGWLARGRQSSDMSERLLFFFTAIEALLSGNDQFSPVSDTIARFVSVILSSDPKTRSSIHSNMKELYGLRSGLIHRGMREAHLLHANNVQHYSEACFFMVIDRVDLSIKHSEFLSSLKKATHGNSWPPATWS